MKKFTCIMCPVGCSLSAEKIGEEVKVTGNKCPRGKTYAEQEMTCPKRIVTALAKTVDGKVVAVKTTIPIPKELIFSVLKMIAKLRLTEYKFGKVVIKNVLNTGSDIVITS